MISAVSICHFTLLQTRPAPAPPPLLANAPSYDWKSTRFSAVSRSRRAYIMSAPKIRAVVAITSHRKLNTCRQVQAAVQEAVQKAVQQA